MIWYMKRDLKQNKLKGIGKMGRDLDLVEYVVLFVVGILMGILLSR